MNKPVIEQPDATEQRWTKTATDALVGRKIALVRYMTREEQATMAWFERGLILVLDDGTLVMVQSDDEGNRPGALFVQSPKSHQSHRAVTLPVLR